MRNKFDMQLELLNEQLTRMGELCELAINRVTKALVEGNLEQAKKVMAADEEIDQMEKDIERLCLKLLLQQQPAASVILRVTKFSPLRSLSWLNSMPLQQYML